MSTQPEALRLADELAQCHAGHVDEGPTIFSEAAAELRRLHEENTALRRAIEQAEQQEPVAWYDPEVMNEDCGISWTQGQFHTVPLYTTPPPRQPLTDDEISALRREVAALSANALDDYKMIQSLMAERQPLTDEQIKQIELSLRQYNSRDTYDLSLNDFARAIEAACIKGEA